MAETKEVEKAVKEALTKAAEAHKAELAELEKTHTAEMTQCVEGYKAELEKQAAAGLAVLAEKDKEIEALKEQLAGQTLQGGPAKESKQPEVKLAKPGTKLTCVRSCQIREGKLIKPVMVGEELTVTADMVYPPECFRD